MTKTVAVAMSGGVDSTAAAILLLGAGYRVIGLTMETGVGGGKAAAEAARRAARRLGVEHHVLDVSRKFREEVVEPFCQEYLAGRTPNPCLACNRRLKFGVLWERARALGADLLATGHYARVEEGPPGVFRLLKALDAGKDQSYFLYALGQAELSRCVLPLGRLTKDEARRVAAARGLAGVALPESQDVCFVPRTGRARLIAGLTGTKPVPGPIRDTGGRLLGTHRGLVFYTIGQRRGLGLPGPEPFYVLALDHRTNTVVVGPARAAGSRWLVAREATYVSGRRPPDGSRLRARLRHRGREVEAVFRPLPDSPEGSPSGSFHLEFAEPQRAVAPGQAAVLYDGLEVVGGGIIVASEAEERARSALVLPGDENDS